MTSSSEDSKWQKLDWKEKVQICQQGIAHEDTLLITYVVIFIGLEALFFASVFTGKLGSFANIFIAVLGILVAVHFICIFKRAGDAVDRWGAILYVLWSVLNKQEKYISGIKTSEFVKLHKPSIERRKRLKKGKIKGWLKVVFGWWDNKCNFGKGKLRRLKILGCNLCGIFMGRRRMMTTWTPILVIVAWAFIIYHILDTQAFGS